MSLVERAKGLQRDVSKETLNVVKVREGTSANKETLSSVPSQPNLQSQRAQNPIYRSHGQQPIQVAHMYERNHQN